MARIRTIKPEFFKHLRLYEAEIEFGLPLRVAFAGLWTCADREGRFQWIPRQLKIDILPYDDVDFSRVLDALLTRGFLVKYACKDREFGAIPSWKTHQFINNKEPKSELPVPPDEIAQVIENQQLDACATREPRVNDAFGTRGVKEGKGREGKGKESTREFVPVVVEHETEIFDGDMWFQAACAAYVPGKVTGAESHLFCDCCQEECKDRGIKLMTSAAKWVIERIELHAKALQAHRAPERIPLFRNFLAKRDYRLDPPTDVTVQSKPQSSPPSASQLAMEELGERPVIDQAELDKKLNAILGD
jgi:hypothetical protein